MYQMYLDMSDEHDISIKMYLVATLGKRVSYDGYITEPDKTPIYDMFGRSIHINNFVGALSSERWKLIFLQYNILDIILEYQSLHTSYKYSPLSCVVDDLYDAYKNNKVNVIFNQDMNRYELIH